MEVASCRFPTLHSALPKALDFKQLEQAFYNCKLEYSGSACWQTNHRMKFDTTLHILVFAFAVSKLILAKKENNFKLKRAAFRGLVSLQPIRALIKVAFCNRG